MVSNGGPVMVEGRKALQWWGGERKEAGWKGGIILDVISGLLNLSLLLLKALELGNGSFPHLGYF